MKNHISKYQGPGTLIPRNTSEHDKNVFSMIRVIAHAQKVFEMYLWTVIIDHQTDIYFNNWAELHENSPSGISVISTV